MEVQVPEVTPPPAASPAKDSPKTTLAGLVAAIGVALLAGGDYFDVSALKALGGSVAAIGAALVGVLAKDK
jgi:hypothetical protein